MIKELIRKTVGPFNLKAGDRLELIWKWDIPGMGENLLAEVHADRDMIIDSVIISRFENMYGLKEGYSIVAGKSNMVFSE